MSDGNNNNKDWVSEVYRWAPTWLAEKRKRYKEFKLAKSPSRRTFFFFNVLLAIELLFQAVKNEKKRNKNEGFQEYYRFSFFHALICGVLIAPWYSV